jgi:leucyl aminopeptidase (aminopeptidase T)
MQYDLCKWCGMRRKDTVCIITDNEQMKLAQQLAEEIGHTSKEVQIFNAEETEDSLAKMSFLKDTDLALVLLSVHSFMGGLNKIFSPFKKPTGLKAKYAFIRLDINSESLRQGLSTDMGIVDSTVNGLYSFNSRKIKIHNQAGTDLQLTCSSFQAASYKIADPGAFAFLPPSECYTGVFEANGRIVIDVTIGQLIYNGRFLDEFGLVDQPAVLEIKDSKVIKIRGGVMAERLRERLFSLPDECRVVVELGFGLSSMKPTGIIGVDESILHTCHFGIGDGTMYGVNNTAPIHLDVVIYEPSISLLLNA